jgi:transposase
MIHIDARTRVLIATEPLDMRNGIDGIAALCRTRMYTDPMNGTVFAFVNRARTHIRLLFYDGQGFWLCTKRLSKGRFGFWPKGSEPLHLVSEQLHVLIRGGDPLGFQKMNNWRDVG